MGAAPNTHTLTLWEQLPSVWNFTGSDGTSAVCKGRAGDGTKPFVLIQVRRDWLRRLRLPTAVLGGTKAEL